MSSCRRGGRPWACAAREEINAQADINFYENWQAFAAIQRDLIAGQMLDTEYGLGYEDECLAISLAYRRKYTSRAAACRPRPRSSCAFSLKTGDQPIAAFQPVPPGHLLLQPPLMTSP